MSSLLSGLFPGLRAKNNLEINASLSERLSHNNNSGATTPANLDESGFTDFDKLSDFDPNELMMIQSNTNIISVMNTPKKVR